MEKFLDDILGHIDWIVVVIVLCSGFFQKNYIKKPVLSKDEGYNSALKTLVLSAIFSVAYTLLAKNPDNPINWSQFFFSYVFSTSLYEILVAPFTRWLMKISGTKPPDQP